MRSAIVFDIDDTLYLERDYVKSGFEAVGAHLQDSLQLTGFAETAWRLFEAGVRGQTFDRALCELGLVPSGAIIREAVRVYREHEPQIEMLEDARELIQYLASRGIGMGVITDGPAASQRAKASALGLDRSIRSAIFTDELGPGNAKPNPMSFELMARLLGKPDRLAYIADNPAKDFAAPSSLGWSTVRVRRHGGLYSDRESGQDVAVETGRLTIGSLEFFLSH